jgi:hypothetical protein
MPVESIERKSSPSRLTPNSEKPGGLDGSTQHLLELHAQEPTKLNSFKGVVANGIQPCLGYD